MSSYWYVLTHPSPAQIEWMLQRENLGEFRREGETMPEPIEYFIPFQFLLRAPVPPAPTSSAEDYADRLVWDPQAEVDNGVREALHSYIFVHADEKRVAQLLESEWNRAGRLHLFQHRNSSGEPLRVMDNEMRRFIDTLRNRQLRYYLGQPLEALEVGDTVTLHLAPWEGRKAIITRLELRGGRSKLTVTIDVLGNLTRVTFPDVHDGDVTFDDEVLGRLLSGNLIHNFEQEIIAIMARRFGCKPSDDDRRRDNSRLMRMYGYSGVIVDGTDDHQRFTALMLICAALLGEQEAKRRYVEQVHGWLGDHKEPTNDTEAYLMIALFVAQRKPALREAVKTYRNAHDDCPEVIRRMLSKVKRLRCR